MAARKSTPPPVADEQPTPEPAPPAKADRPAGEPQERTAVEAVYVDALQREREGYTRYSRKDRAADVEAELRRLGAPFERAVPQPRETA
ncbi:hypothetical protein [Streptomyces sp. B1I3]|uniref:hypothetical protein n=1 Tax=Streptomyces sp. B1I3 TaxID=3042264 RepID=UPI00277E1197|nr:hypothetical protein [Streptomyces sp. B1I3]MDQ0795577.1 hypothetical protein [Streptomyces sp. B1I3]